MDNWGVRRGELGLCMSPGAAYKGREPHWPSRWVPLGGEGEEKKWHPDPKDGKCKAWETPMMSDVIATQERVTR